MCHVCLLFQVGNCTMELVVECGQVKKTFRLESLLQHCHLSFAPLFPRLLLLPLLIVMLLSMNLVQFARQFRLIQSGNSGAYELTGHGMRLIADSNVFD